jgi:galactonate dehydratase
LGLTALKFCPTGKVLPVDSTQVIESVIEKVAAVRSTVGTNFDIMLDFHGRASPAMAVQLEEALRPYRPLFIEEPVLPENVDELARIERKFRTPIATGERLFTKWAFREVLEKGAAQILQPDPCICGGIREAVIIAGLAECNYAAVAPHNPYGPINMAASMHVAAAIPNFLIQEYVHLGEGYLKQPFEAIDGFVALPRGPGLGIEVDEDFVRAHYLEPLPDVGQWFHESDGSVADW